MALGWLMGGIGKAAEKIGDAVQKNYRTFRGDKAAAQEHVHDEQMAVLAQFAAEMAARKTATRWDSFVDGLNRLPRPIIIFSIIGAFGFCFYDPYRFAIYMTAFDVVPDELWTMWLMIMVFLFGSRVVSEDIRKPRITTKQRERALEIIKEREAAIMEARTPQIVASPPPRKPPVPSLSVPPIPLPHVDPHIPVSRGRPPEINAMIWNLIEREGGYVNNPNDSGGPTNHGITQDTLEAWREKACTIEDVRALTKEEAFDIYLSEYYFGPSIDSLPLGLQGHMLDISANSGPRQAVKLLQGALNTLGAGVKVDGVIGPMTREACNSLPLPNIHNALVETRKQFYRHLASSRPKDRVFLDGWLARAEAFAA